MEIAEKFKIPEEKGCGHIGEIVWISEDKKTIAVKCPKYHPKDPFTNEPYKKNPYGEKPGKKNIVYIIDIS